MERKDRTITITLNLTETAKNFGYKAEADIFDDVWHNGYSAKDIRKQGSYSSNHKDLEKYLPQVIGTALEYAERSALAEAIVDYSLNGLKDALLKIDLSGGGAEYQDMNGNMVSEKAGIVDVEIDRANDEIKVSILNPEHLINTVVAGVGRFYPDLPTDEEAEISEIAARFHHLNDFFDVYGERKPSGELPSQFVPNINDEYFEEEISTILSEMILSDVAEAVLDYVDYYQEKAPYAEFAKVVSFSEKQIKEETLRIQKNQDERKQDLLK